MISVYLNLSLSLYFQNIFYSIRFKNTGYLCKLMAPYISNHVINTIRLNFSSIEITSIGNWLAAQTSDVI